MASVTNETPTAKLNGKRTPSTQHNSIRIGAESSRRILLIVEAAYAITIGSVNNSSPKPRLIAVKLFR